MLYLTPFLAVVLTMFGGILLFAALGKDPAAAMSLIFYEPLTTPRGWSELTVKAAPLVIIAIGLSVGFLAGVWNIGAEGQYCIGALAGGAVALAVFPTNGVWLLPMMSVAAILGGMAWAAIPAFLRTRFGTSEILVSLMLVYVAVLLLSVLVTGPLRDPQGLNFPESRMFQDSAKVPKLASGFRMHVGAIVALLVVGVGWVLIARHVIGFQVRVLGEAPRAARFAGISEQRIVWLTMLLSGGLAGLSGLFEAAGPVGQLVPALPAGYGFTAIIVAFLGRLHPVGILLAGLLMALTYIGGEKAQIVMQLPSATVSTFQGMLLFFLLATDVFVNYRLRIGRRAAAVDDSSASLPATAKPEAAE